MNSVNLELTPFIYNSEKEPVEFDITFEMDKVIYRYFLSIELGNFLSKDGREILEEILEINSKNIYIRENKKINVFFENMKDIYLNEGFSRNLLESYDLIMNSNLESTKLFLSTEFRSLISKELYNNIYKWFDEKLLVFNNFYQFSSVLELEKNEYKQVPKELYEAVNKIGVLATDMFFRKTDENEIPVLYSVLQFNNNKVLIPSRMIESVGTLHFIDLFPLIMLSLQEGITLVIDEMDASLHPMVVMSVVNLFHNPNINKNNAQLIFNTHNPIYLNNSVFRRDEMCFVEKDKDTRISDFYKLSDFMTNSGTSTRNTTDYINNYFKNKYGAIEYVDLSEIFDIPKNGEE